MPMQPVYLISVSNLPRFLEAIRHAQAPEKFTIKFVEQLGFTSTNDRFFLSLLRAMKFLDEGGKPTNRYHAFLDDTQWARVLAEGVRDAYSELFRVNRQAEALSRPELGGKIKSLTEGKISPAVLIKTTATFLALVKLADFSSPTELSTLAVTAQESAKEVGVPQPEGAPKQSEVASETGRTADRVSTPSLVYRIEIVLPAVRDQAVYDAIFRSAREHLLK